MHLLDGRRIRKRLKELGIRMALGAQRKEVLMAAPGRPLRLLALGSTAGLVPGLAIDPLRFLREEPQGRLAAGRTAPPKPLALFHRAAGAIQ